ncbi:MAG TPA: hypothetical protein IGS53_27805 [Leptolyngbyaceae cyanobacterium M33_DOE_097]|uniref:Uncharacterized protein n=1 Tax=Oscillatoriales cyanobacterium SpSt-418 TaxID=2282169 RepID=A0A7C3KCA5_9CYAN|nr:hypothetical protein [Leptolyngbyaceae cyanobacterium M33_DOE_097]
MVISLTQIEKDLAKLDQAVVHLSEEMQAAYSDYLNRLGTATQKQLVMAAYQVCTEGYPEQFLKLTAGQREDLQKIVRQLAKQIREELMAQLYPPTVEVALEVERPQPDALLSQILQQAHAELQVELPELVSDVQLRSESETQPSPEPPPSEPRSLTPAPLARWQQNLEQAIMNELQTASHAVNRTLQQATILPNKLPEPLLEAASKAEASDIGGGKPNLLNLLVEARQPTAESESVPDEPKRAGLVHIVAVNLRLAEIEFADVPLGAARTQIRQLQAQLKKLGQDYQKKQKERAIAQAQAAWRTSWYED